ncbi:MAG: fucose isomerase [Candidatus Heimdallarchaeota archaeon]|nr:fucose isomerase [Candidatus Heimdallarchaeota archaeon]
MKQRITIGVVCLARKTFDFDAAKKIYMQIQNDLARIIDVDWVFSKGLIVEINDAQKIAKHFKENHIDGLAVISGTFALGHLILELHKIIQKPILLWGLDELPYDGGKIRLNSICGVNLNASNLYKSGVRNYHSTFGDQIDENWLDAIRIIKAFSTAHVGLVGYRAKGFFNLDVDELSLFRELGILIDHYEISEVINYQVNVEQINERKKQLEGLFDVTNLTINQINKVAELIAKIDSFIEENQLTCLAIRCWPEFTATFGISPCAAMSVLQSEGKILACEGDILGSLTMVAQKAIGGETPYLVDFSQVDFKENFALLWHCGVAPSNLWDGECERSLDSYFAEGKGVTADFVLKEGEMTLTRIDYALGEYRLFIQKGKAIPMNKDLKGTYAKIIFEDGVKIVLSKIVKNGIAHHLSVIYGNYVEPFRILVKLMNWVLIE